MFQHVLVPIDCTDGSRHLIEKVARFVTPLVPCRVTLAAAVTPTDNAELRDKRRRHAGDALRNLQQELLHEGIWSRSVIVEGKSHAKAITEEATDASILYDAIVLGTHQTRPEDLDAPCKGSFADEICALSHLPVVVLPSERGRAQRRYDIK